MNRIKKFIPYIAIGAALLIICTAVLIINIVKKDVSEKEQEPLSVGVEKMDSTGKDTLLVYMIGSDLEARSGAGTDDLKEIEESGIDLNSANVLVYAGGSPRWHNDMATKEKNTVLQLVKDGFQVISTMDCTTMGGSDSLLEFLNYSYENYPSDSYSLIMWNHGNGPVIGYGKDMLFDNDSLTLEEMRTALEQSPFGEDNKLEWVGFDACLMASAELVCVWDDYAKYLVASQEVEPSFGWNYNFLKDFGVLETTELLSVTLDGYMEACEAYYKKRGYEDRDTTLSCMDLSYAKDLENAINNLFSKASGEVNIKYNTLASKRVETRALGRASTGSEYDLIDLNDMAVQLENVYPAETKALRDAIEKVVIKNTTNTEGCCGLSLYYPFYNKYYFEESWGDVYAELDIFKSYGSYLNKYQNIWLGDDKLYNYSSRLMLKVEENNKYSLQLTQQQKENFAEARFYVLKNMGDDLYHIVFTGQDITNKNGLLTANYDGRGIFAKDKFDNYVLPVSVAYDTVGNITRYSVATFVSVPNSSEIKLFDFHLAANSRNNKVSLSAMLPHVKEENLNSLVGGKLEEQDINAWDVYNFPYVNYLFMTRYDNGAVRPLEQWVEHSAASGYSLASKDDISFVYAPLDNGEYYLIFEMTDTQGNKFCSELLPIEVEGTDRPGYRPPPIDVNWQGGDSVKLFEQQNVEVYMKKKLLYGSDPVYAVEVVNHNNFQVKVRFEDVILNGNICPSYGAYVDVKANETAESYFSIMTEASIGVLDSISRIEGMFSVTNTDNNSTLVLNQKVIIALSGDAMLKDLSTQYRQLRLTETLMDARAEEQILFENDKLRVTLLGFGSAEYSSYSGYYCAENLSSQPMNVKMAAISANDVTFLGGQGKTIPQGCRHYGTISLSEYTLKNNNISSIGSLKLMLALYEDEGILDSPDYYSWIPVELAEKGEIQAAQSDDGQIVFYKNGVKVIVKDCYIKYDRVYWRTTVINDSDNDIGIYFSNGVDDNTEAGMNPSRVGAHQKLYSDIFSTNYNEIVEKISFNINVTNFWQTELLFSGEQTVTLYAEVEEETEEKNVQKTENSEGTEEELSESEEGTEQIVEEQSETENVTEEPKPMDDLNETESSENSDNANEEDLEPEE